MFYSNLKVLGSIKANSEKMNTTSIFSVFKFVFYLYQRTPLYVAARKGNYRIVKCLLDKGAGINIKDNAGASVTMLLLLVDYC